MSDSETLARPDTAAGTKKTPQKAEYIKRNLKKTVSDGGTGSGKTVAWDYRGEYQKLKGEEPYSGFPAPLKTSLSDPMEKALTGASDQAKLSALESFKKNLKTAADSKKSWSDAAGRVSALDTQIAHLERWNAGSASKVRGRLQASTDKAAEGKYAEAAGDLPGLEKDVPDAIRSHYEGARKPLQKNEAEVKKLGGAPPYLATLKQDCTDSAKAVDDFVTAKKYVEAVDGLPDLEKKLAAALTGGKRAVREQKVKSRCDDIKNELDREISFKREGDTVKTDTPIREAVGSKEWKDTVKKIVETKLDDEFMEQYNTSMDEVIDKLSKNPKIQEAHKNWKTWTSDYAANESNIKDAMQEILKVQSEALGWPTPTAAPYSRNDGDCGSFSGDGYPPGTLKVNFHYKSSTDFRELMDTVAHENTHAYQEKLIRGFRDGTIKPGNLEYSAAMVLEMNDTRGTRGYISGAKSEKYSKFRGDYAYEKQPCEAHAWGAGRKVGRTTYKNLEKSK